MAIKHVVTRGFIGSGTGIIFVPTAGFSSSSVIIVSGPFCIDAQQTYIAGAVTGEGYTAGAIKIQQYVAGPKTQDGDC